ncbi:hypothetical protein KY285_030175 [Solanum tuberosum]|nr:hypothetical protein KY285_030175 [Solanum tuberosum]
MEGGNSVAVVNVGGSVLKGLLSQLSLIVWDQDDPYDMGGDHCFLPGGNGILVDALTQNVATIFEKSVHAIRYGRDSVKVNYWGQLFERDMAFFTVPLRVFKSGSIRFILEFPQQKLDTVKRLSFGIFRDDGKPVDKNLDKKKWRLLIMYFWIRQASSDKKLSHGSTDPYCHYKNIQTRRKPVPLPQTSQRVNFLLSRVKRRRAKAPHNYISSDIPNR